MKNIFKTIGINLAVFFVLIGIIVFVPILIFETYKFTNFVKNNLNVTKNQENREFKKLKNSYIDFLSYKYDEYNGKLITIDSDGNRVTVLSKFINKELPSFIFFGPSTIWGLGLKDENTIPSTFSKKNNAFVENLSVPGYVTRQSFAKLANYYIKEKTKKRKKIIIFNDGAMDFVLPYDCNNMSPTTLITDKLESSYNISDYSFLKLDLIVKPMYILYQKAKDKFSKKVNILEKCEEKILNNKVNIMLKSWSLANALSLAHGDTFVAVLTPVSFDDDIKIATDNSSNEKKQLFIKKAYKLIRKEIKKYPEIKFIDLTKIYNGNPVNYIDTTHYSYIGSQKYVDSLSKKLVELKILEEYE